MAANAHVGKDGKVSLGSDKIVGIGTWTVNLGSTDEFDASEFGDDWELIKFGMRRGGSISFNGNFYPEDTTGQNAAMQAFIKGTDLTDLRLYWSDNSYWAPNSTAGYFSPDLTTGAGTPAGSTARITACEITDDKSGLAKINFTARISGSMFHN
jgi:hypothetical protein